MDDRTLPVPHEFLQIICPCGIEGRLFEDSPENMGQDHADGHAKGLPCDHIDAVTVNRLRDSISYAELAEDQAVELTFVFQGIDDHPLLGKRLQPLRRLIGNPDLGKHLPDQPVEGEVVLSVKTPHMVDSDLRRP